MTVKEIKGVHPTRGVHPTIKKISEALSCEAMTTQSMMDSFLKKRREAGLLSSPTKLSFSVMGFEVETIVDQALDTGVLLFENCKHWNIELYKEDQWIMLYLTEKKLLNEAIVKTLSQSRQDTRDLLGAVKF